MNLDQKGFRSVCVSDDEPISFLGDFQVDGMKGLTTLRSATDPDAKAKRFELIEAARAGKHIELQFDAIPFLQRNKPNRRHLRLGGDVAPQAKTFSSRPFIVDHNTSEQSARRGTILTSRSVEEGSKLHFEQRMIATKSDGVISLLDGTIDRFSIGWFPEGPVLCTAHQVDVRSSSESCYCYPGSLVTIGKETRTVEYLFTKWSGKETSGVTVPAVDNTSIERFLSALSAELDLPTNPHRVSVHVTNKEQSMRFHSLAKALGLAAKGESGLEEAEALEAVEALRSRAAADKSTIARLNEEKAALEADLVGTRQAAALAAKAAAKTQIDGILADAYREGKLINGRDEDGNPIPSKLEARLRRIGAEPDGIESLRAEIEEMPVKAKLNRSPASRRGGIGLSIDGSDGEADGEDDDNPKNLGLHPAVLSVCRQMNIKPEAAKDFIDNHEGGV